MESPSAELIVAAGDCRSRNLRCPQCSNVASKWERHSRYSWCLVLKCGTCKKMRWFVCTVCNSIRCCYVKHSSLAPHGSKFHNDLSKQTRKRRRSNDESSGSVADNNGNENEENHDEQHGGDDTTIIAGSVNSNSTEKTPSADSNSDYQGDDILDEGAEDKDDEKPSAIVVNDLNYLGNKASINYFLHANNGNGTKYLVSNAHYQSNLFTDKISDVDTSLNIRLARFCNELTSKQTASLAEVLMLVNQQRMQQTSPTEPAMTPKTVDLTIPSSVNEFRKLFYDSKFSIEHNLPKPTVHRAGEYCYVRPQDCIANLLAHGALVDNLLEDLGHPISAPNTVESFRSCPQVQSIKESWEKKILSSDRENVIMLWMSWWADAFEPNSSIKQNRLSVWIKTLTISKPSWLHDNDVTNTFPIAMGSKNGKKSVVESAIMKDLDALDLDKVGSVHQLPLMFDKRSGKMKHVCAKVVICVHDQIDRRGVLNLAYGNSKYHGMFGWSYDFGKRYESVVACEDCHLSMLWEQYYRDRNDPQPRHR